jgi:two-component system, OmpR family, KDP operon response regulator KdpE
MGCALLSSAIGLQPLVLVVENDSPRGPSLVSALASHGFRTLQAPPRADALARLFGHEPDLVLFDASTTNVDGVGLTTRLHAWTTAPIVAIVGNARESERALLDAGASDYVVRPFAPSDLLARVRVWLWQKRRTHTRHFMGDVAIERLHIDRDRHAVFVGPRQVHVTPLEAKLLTALGRSPGQRMTEDQITAALWGASHTGRTRYLRACIRNLRYKIERDPVHPRYLLTEAGGSYRLRMQ